MKERPIIFSAESINAIRDGRKTQTRRVLKPQPPEGVEMHMLMGPQRRPSDGAAMYNNAMTVGQGYQSEFFHCRQGIDGDRLWVKENRFTPRDRSPGLLEITELDCEQLHDISDDDILAEGIRRDVEKPHPLDQDTHPDLSVYAFLRVDFCRHWDDLNGKKHPWDSNPWVWVITFKVLEFPNGK